MNERIEKAKEYAHCAHDSIGQKRKYTGEPYWVHTDAVANTVAEVGGSEDMVIAAHLHDVFEDVWPVNQGYPYSEMEVQKLFGEQVLSYVKWLTDLYTKENYGDLNRAKRKALERERLMTAPVEVKTIKLADLIDNTKSIAEHDKDFARVYLKEKLALLSALSDGNPDLLQLASMQVVTYSARLGLPVPMFCAKV
jgi:(p)ppGpp synthase/HD superfamily hydrolase